MTNTSENLWGKDFKINKINTPIAILKEQAKYLKEMTKGVLIGEISSGFGEKNSTDIYFAIKAPFLNNYKVNIIKVEQHITSIYPLKVINLVDGTSLLDYIFVTINDEIQFKNEIKKILGRESVSYIIGNLISQSEVAV